MSSFISSPTGVDGLSSPFIFASTSLNLSLIHIWTEQGCLLGIADHEKPGVIVRIVVDVFLQHLHAVHVGSVRRAVLL